METRAYKPNPWRTGSAFHKDLNMETVLSQRVNAQSDQNLVLESVKTAHELQLIHEEAWSLASIESNSSRGPGK